MMYFDGFSSRDVAWEGLVVISLKKLILPFEFVLGQTCSYNAVYNTTVIVVLEIASSMKIRQFISMMTPK